MSDYVTINKQRFKYAKRINGLNNQQLARLLGYAEDTIDKITRQKSKGTIEPNTFKKLCQILDVTPGYLTGTENEQAGNFFTDILSLKKIAYKKKYNISEDSVYNTIRKLTKTRIDPDGVYMHPYSAYLCEISDTESLDRFRRWLMSINLNDLILYYHLEFPTNEELEKILPPVESMEFVDFWEYMVNSVYQYLVSNNLFIPPLGENPTEEERDNRFSVKFADCEKIKLEEI